MPTWADCGEAWLEEVLEKEEGVCRRPDGVQVRLEAGWLCDPNPKTRDGWEVLSDIKQVLKEDAGLALNDKTKILVKGISAADAHAAAQRLLIADPSLAHLSPLLSPASFVVDGYIGLGVPIGLMLLSSTL